jgi:hypothetical protein
MDQPAGALNPDPPEFSLGAFIETLKAVVRPFHGPGPSRSFATGKISLIFLPKTENGKQKTVVKKEPKNMCTICRHPSRPVIERDLLACPSVGSVAAHYNLPFHEAVKHKTRLEARVEQARQQVEQLLLTENLSRLNLLVEKTMKIVAAAEEKGDLKLMMQAIREAGRLTQMIHALPVDLAASALFLSATDKEWPRAASPLPTQPWVRDSVRQAIQQSLKNPCAVSHFEPDLSPPQASPPARPVAALRRARSAPRPHAAVIPWPSAGGDTLVSGAATALPDGPAAVEIGRAGPG